MNKLYLPEALGQSLKTTAPSYAAQKSASGALLLGLGGATLWLAGLFLIGLAILVVPLLIKKLK